MVMRMRSVSTWIVLAVSAGLFRLATTTSRSAATRCVAVAATTHHPNQSTTNNGVLMRPCSSRRRRQGPLLGSGRGVPRAKSQQQKKVPQLLFWSGGAETTTTTTTTTTPSTSSWSLDEKEDVTRKIVTLSSRGGGGTTTSKAAVNTNNNPPPTLSRALAGAAVFALIEQLVKRGLLVAQVKYPAGLGACIILFTVLCLTDAVAPAVAQSVYEALSPGAALLAQWFPVFFVPGLALLPLSPSIGGTVDVLKIIFTVCLGFIYSMASTLGGVVAVRTLLGKPATTTTASSKSGATITTTKKKSPFSDQQWNIAWKSALLTSIISIVATNLRTLASPLQMVFTMCLTVACYIGASRLPSAYNAIVHPLVTSSVAFLVVLRTLAAINGQAFLDVLKTYKTGSLHLQTAGAADYLFYILGPSVVSFAIAVYSRKSLLFQNLPMVLTAMVISSAGGLFATGAFVRLIRLGGRTGNAALVRLSLLARNVTTALALPLTEMVGGNMSIAAAAVCLTGILGASYGIPLLNALGIRDPICRGLGIGSSAQGLGVASMAGEPDALPFASVAMVLTAVAATTLASIPSFRNALVTTTVGRTVVAVAA